LIATVIGLIGLTAGLVAVSSYVLVRNSLRSQLVDDSVARAEFNITVLAAQNAQGFAVLEATGHKAPVNAVTAACGLGSMITAAFGTVSTCLTGPVNAIITSSGEKDKHYAAGVMVALMALLYGIFAPAFTRFMLATPKTFIAALAGLAMVRILERAFVVSFGGTFTLGAVVTFLVTVANVPIFSIGAPFWGLVIGYAVSWMLEKDDFKKLAAEQDRT